MTNWRNWFMGCLIAAALIGAVLHRVELRHFLELLRAAQPVWLLVAICLQASTYVSAAMGWRAVLLRARGQHYRLWKLVRIALLKLFADQALPTAGMGGNVLLVDRLVALGASRGTAVATLLLSMVGFYAAYLLFALVALFLLWLDDQATPLMVGVVTSFVLVAIAIPALALWMRRRGDKPLPPAVERIRPIRQLLVTMAKAPARLMHDRPLLLQVIAFNALVFAADILTLDICLRSLGMAVPLRTSLIAFILASIAVTLGPIPFGLGSFELVCTSTLHLLGLPVAPALAGTLLLRVLTLWLPLLPGLVLMRRVIGRGKPSSRPARR